MRKRTQIVAPALVVGIMLFGGYRLAAHPAATPLAVTRSYAPIQFAAETPALLAEAGADIAPASVPFVAPEASDIPAVTLAPAATLAPTVTLEPTATAIPTATAQPTATLEPTSTPLPTATPRPRPTATPQLVSPNRIVAPAIGLDAKVVTVGWHEVVDADGSKHTEWDVASYAAGWHKNSARPGQVGNTVLSGHNNIEGEVFRNLEKFQIGDQITLYASNRTFNYTVTEKFVVQDKGVSLDERVKNARWIGAFPDERVTLVSCWPPTNNTHRMFIIAKPAP